LQSVLIRHGVEHLPSANGIRLAVQIHGFLLFFLFFLFCICHGLGGGLCVPCPSSGSSGPWLLRAAIFINDLINFLNQRLRPGKVTY